MQNVGANQHVAVPTRGQTVVHDGAYASRCAECLVTVQDATSRSLAVNGVPIVVGSLVRPVRQAVGPDHPEWGTVVEIKWNSHEGVFWMHCWEFGTNLVLHQHDIAEVRWPAHLLAASAQRLAAALMKNDAQFHITQGDTLVSQRTAQLLDTLAHQETAATT